MNTYHPNSSINFNPIGNQYITLASDGFKVSGILGIIKEFSPQSRYPQVNGTIDYILPVGRSLAADYLAGGCLIGS